MSADAESIARIYNQGIRERIATLETTERTAAERRTWLEHRSKRHPVLVAVRDERVMGWGSLNAFNSRDAYRFVADVSVYVDSSARRAGAGSALLEALSKEAKRIGFHKLVIAAFPWNDSSLRLFRKFGFRDVGVYREQGVLDGSWVDTIVLEKLLDDDPPPDEPASE